MPDKIKSPITGRVEAILQKQLLASEIIGLYQKQLGMDISGYFAGIETIGIYQCQSSGYRFYDPSPAGGDAFYGQLEANDWYYMSWKWEHSVALPLFHPRSKILEIGCARGTFLAKAKAEGHDVTGLEMNTEAIKSCLTKGIPCKPQAIEDFAKSSPTSFDAVCSFQVLEHVRDIKSFVEASLKVLKPGGLLIASVPNNQSLLVSGNDFALNLPPHHAGLWDMNSLLKLPHHFAMSNESIHLEPLQSYHLKPFFKIADKAVKGKLRHKLGPLSFLAERFAPRFTHAAIDAVKDSIIGHTVLTVYRKNDQ